jgi:hypothetical protein
MSGVKLGGLVVLIALVLGTAWYVLGTRGASDVSDEAVVEVSAFENVGWGLSYDEVTKALGAKGRKVEGGAGETYEWTLADGSRRRMVFIDGRMKFISKPQ